jgi:D-sedoheptulose 7-phosphate isomerase/D-glycero-D-manno-heptose 1,7-bisphosphate phosphatase
MAKAAAKALGLDLAASWVVGDRPEDVGLAEAIGASAVFLGTEACERAGVYAFPSLAAAAPFILERITEMSTVQDLPDVARPASGTPPKFPAAPYDSAAVYFSAYAEETARAASSVETTAVARAAEILLDAYTREATVFSCGNGGSASIANHLQCDHTKNVGNSTDLLPRVMSLSVNVEVLTAIANDHAYDHVFTHQLRSQSRPGDVLVAVSSSGRSANIVTALRWARDHGLRTISLTGFDGGEARTIADVSIHVNGTNYGVIEDLHQAIMHALAQYIRQSRMTPAAISSSVF